MHLFFNVHNPFSRIAIAGFFFLTACAGKASTSSAADGRSAEASAPGDSLYYGKNSLKYSLNGRHVDIKDALKLGEGKYTTVLYVNKASNEGGTITIEITNLITSELFKFKFPAAGGKGSGSYFWTHDQIRFTDDAIPIQVTDLTATHVAVTFSGKYSATDPKPATLDVRDGSFDLLFKK